MLTVGADIGKYRTKISWRGGVRGHLSKLATYREIKDTITLDDNNLIIEYKNQMYLAGELSEREGQNFINSPDLHKSNIVTVLNLLIALSRLPSTDFNVVIGNPFGVNTQKERLLLKELLIGTKEFKVNDKPFRVNVHNLGIAPEGYAAWFSDTTYEDCNIWDFGSTTVNAISVRKKKLIDKRSHTFEEGFETLIDDNYEGLMESLKIRMEKMWSDGTKKIICIGGKAPEMFKYVREQYPNSNAVVHSNFEYANALGLYELGVIAYERTANLAMRS
jgi:hypothetical protein